MYNVLKQVFDSELQTFQVLAKISTKFTKLTDIIESRLEAVWGQGATCTCYHRYEEADDCHHARGRDVLYLEPHLIVFVEYLTIFA